MASPLRRRLVFVVAALAATSCLAPTLPLPPPAEPNLSGPDEQGLIHLSGRAPVGSWVFAMNRVNNVGTFQAARDNGDYDLTLPAKVGDSLFLWYEIDGDTSESLTIEVEP